jgi:hypothetical protein
MILKCKGNENKQNRGLGFRKPIGFLKNIVDLHLTFDEYS